MQTDTDARPRWLALVAGAGAIFALLAARLAATPVAEWGSNGSAWAEHAKRVQWLLAIRENGGLDEPAGPFELLRSMESGFPAGLYLSGVAAEPIVGATASGVAWLGPLWLIPLMWGVGAVASSFGGRRVAPVAALAVLLVPSIPASSLRFYFDLPMTALVWAALGALVVWPRAGALIGGLLGGLACVVKWTALPFLLPLIAALAVARRVGVGAAVGALTVVAAVVAGYLAAVGPENSLLAMAQEARVGDAEGVGGLVGDTLLGLLSLQEEPVARSLFYLGTTVFGVLSLPGLVALVAGAWGRPGRDAWRFLGVTAAGHLAVLFLLVRPVDERFVLTGLPAAVIVAVLGWDRLAGRRRVAVVAAVTLSLVAADLHLGLGLGRPSMDIKVVEGGGPVASQLVGVRGLGLASSFQGRGWWRQDEVPEARPALREAAWAELVRQDARTVVFATGAPAVHDSGDQQWFTYRGALASWRGDGDPPGFQGIDCGDDLPEGPALWLTAEGPAPACPEGVAWRSEGVVADPEGGRGVALWSISPPTTAP